VGLIGVSSTIEVSKIFNPALRLTVGAQAHEGKHLTGLELQGNVGRGERQTAGTELQAGSPLANVRKRTNSLDAAFLVLHNHTRTSWYKALEECVDSRLQGGRAVWRSRWQVVAELRVI